MGRAIVSTGRDGRPVLYKDNPVTRLADRVAEMNAGMGSRMGSIPEGIEVEGDGGAAFSNSNLSETGQGGASFGGGVSPAEAAEREARWAAITGQKVADGAPDPVDAEAEAGYAPAEDTVIPPTVTPPHLVSPPLRSGVAIVGRPGGAAYGFPEVRPQAPARAVDFTRLQTIDFETKTVTVGGAAFTMTDESLHTIAGVALAAVKAALAQDLEVALAKFYVPTVREDQANCGVLLASGEGSTPMQAVHDLAGEEVRSNGEGEGTEEGDASPVSTN